jgi:hypothetical protein
MGLQVGLPISAVPSPSVYRPVSTASAGYYMQCSARTDMRTSRASHRQLKQLYFTRVCRSPRSIGHPPL